MEHFKIDKLRRVANKMLDCGFKLECNDGKGKRFVKYKFSADATVQPVRIIIKAT